MTADRFPPQRVIIAGNLALLPRLVPDALLREANSISRMAMNSGQMAGAAAGACWSRRPGMLTELRGGWAEFRSHTWLWVIVVQFCPAGRCCSWC